MLQPVPPTGGNDPAEKSYGRGITKDLYDQFKKTEGSATSVDKTIESIGISVQKLNTQLGGSASATSTLGVNFTDAGLKILQVTDSVQTLEHAIIEAGKIQGEIIGATGRAYRATGKELSGILTAQEASGVQSEVLLKNFKAQAYSLEAIPKTIEKVIQTSKELGLNANAVTTLVVQNLGKLNTFNFANGVEGLTRMAAQATMLGIDMAKILTQAEKLFDPEAAVEMASTLQRLGVATGELLDPLKLMDLGQNNPEELQNQIVEMSKRFTYFNEQNQQFEILPGAKRELKEIGAAIGLGADELAKLALGSSDLSRKMESIRFPELDTGPLTEDQKTMIANLSEMKDGSYKIQIQETQVNENGERFATGEVSDPKDISQLTSEDLKSLQYQEKEASKSLEEIAKENMGYSKRIANAVESGLSTGKASLATSRLANKGTEFFNKEIAKLGDSLGKLSGQKGRELVNNVMPELRDLTDKYAKAMEDGSISEDEKNDLTKSGQGIDDILKNAKNAGVELVSGLGKQIADFLPGLKRTMDEATVKSKVKKSSTQNAETSQDILQRGGTGNYIMQNIMDYKNQKPQTGSNVQTVGGSTMNQVVPGTNNTSQSVLESSSKSIGMLDDMSKQDSTAQQINYQGSIEITIVGSGGMSNTELAETIKKEINKPEIITAMLSGQKRIQDNYGVTGGKVGEYQNTSST